MLEFELAGGLIHIHGGKIDLVFPNGTQFSTMQARSDESVEWALFAWSDPVKEN